ncbi:MAG: hypothetical protein ACXU82_03620 [Caulobacteraceae bacterium]
MSAGAFTPDQEAEIRRIVATAIAAREAELAAAAAERDRRIALGRARNNERFAIRARGWQVAEVNYAAFEVAAAALKGAP